MTLEQKWVRANSNRDYNTDQLIFTNRYSTPAAWPFMDQFDTSQPLRMMEIGCQEGRTSLYLLDKYLGNDNSEIFCLDLFPDSKFGMEANFDHNVKVSGVTDKVTKLKGPSWQSLRSIDEYESFDLIYIDGWHGAHGVLDDAVLTWKLLKVGGIVVFDDYKWRPKGATDERCPRLAVDAFHSIYHIFLEEIVIGDGRQRAFKKLICNNDEVEHCGNVGGASFVPNN